MKRYTAIAGVSAAALLGTGGFLLPATASPASATHTIVLTSVTKKTKTFPVHHPYLDHVAGLDVDLNSAGKVVGYDTTNVTFNGKAHTGHGWVAINLAGGLIEGTVGVTSSGIVATITGGTGTYSHITGTAKVVDLNKSGSRTKVTIVYKH
jgi:hypothetical protein